MNNRIEEARERKDKLWEQYLKTFSEEDRKAWAQSLRELQNIIAEEWRKFTTSG